MAKMLVFGHQNPDTDTIASAFAASYLLNKAYNQDTEAVALGTPNAETQFALNYFKVDAPRVIESLKKLSWLTTTRPHNQLLTLLT